MQMILRPTTPRRQQHNKGGSKGVLTACNNVATLTTDFTVTSSRPVTFIGHNVACECETALKDDVIGTDGNYEAIARGIIAIKSEFASGV